MDWSVSALAVGVLAFFFTNIDDLFVVSALFADRLLAKRAVVIGQFLGIGALTLASAAAALLAAAVPAGWLALLGVVPLLMGLNRLGDLRGGEREDDEQIRLGEHRAQRRLHSQALAVAAITIGNGGDNLAVYIPMFAGTPRAVPAYAAVFAAMTALWCLVAWALVDNRVAGHLLRPLAHRALPLVLIGLGLYILSGAAVLLR
jgi:cadmium resistance protein CadD (predicted permease)